MDAVTNSSESERHDLVAAMGIRGVLITMLCVTGWPARCYHCGEHRTSWCCILVRGDAGRLLFWISDVLPVVAYRETRWLSRVLWLLGILALGNIAMSAYMLLALWRLPVNAPIDRLLLRQRT